MNDALARVRAEKAQLEEEAEAAGRCAELEARLKGRAGLHEKQQQELAAAREEQERLWHRVVEFVV